MATFLLEIGTEELPADFARLALPQLETIVHRDLLHRRLPHGEITCTSTPRRIVLLVDGLPEFASDSEDEFRGPPASKAFENGSPTKAAIGFARRFNLEPSQLEVREISKGSFVFARVLEKGLSSVELLCELIPDWVGSLQGRRFMRWSDGERRFSRPIRWIVALLDNTLIPVSFRDINPPICSANLTKGNRLHENSIQISTAIDYIPIVTNSGVYINRDMRKNYIRDLINQTSAEQNAVPDLPDALLDELTDLVESPIIIQGSFDESFLELPTEVLCTVMRVHQRYVPLFIKRDSDDLLALDAKKTLLPSFLCISNGLPSAKQVIKLGNERVLKARLADAEFFVKSDLLTTSHDRSTKLNTVTFAEGLGTLFDRVKRITWLAAKSIDLLNMSDTLAQHTFRAATFCKHDLVSQIVSEFPELQGIMGGKYLLAEGESREVSLAVLEHYLPRGSGDALPKSPAGAVLSLAERLETLLSIFAKGIRPSGSSDPYALRRSANGILQIIWGFDWQIDLNKLIELAIAYWIESLPGLNINTSILFNDLSEFFRLRMISLFEESGIDSDLVQSVAGRTIPIERLLLDPNDAKVRVNLLVEMRSSDQLNQVQEVVLRASRLAGKNNLDKNIVSANGIVKPELFEKSSEAKMLEVLNSLEPIVRSTSSDKYILLAQGLVGGSIALSEFFDGSQSVMVMTDNPSVRENRLNLLSILCNQAFTLADFIQIQS